MTTSTGGPAPTPAPGHEPIRAVPLRHPWRNVIGAVLIIAIAAIVWDAAVNRQAYDWPAVGKYLFDRRISEAAFVTLQLTVYSMVGAIVLGIILAVMRLSPNPILKSIAWVYIWIFRGTPVYVQLVFWGLLSTIYPTLDIGLPFLPPIAQLPTDQALNTFWIAVIGLALNEAAYMSEIVRAGILSVDRGQEEAATALGMGWGLTMRRIIIPQAMRIIIPPTGNEVISMLKTTSLVTAVPFTLDLYTRSRDISAETFNPIPLLIVASLWYLFVTSILMVGQYFLERRFARGLDRVDLTKGARLPQGDAPSVDSIANARGESEERR
ncbi:amino acid ABC transporter permease [Naasia sp. SYSU D00057]|uniref:amino acid ABC transporter permease n=1 Tax=Naasia sp. SYSU D00057 TaxID=2817380 RepID=UPI001B300F5C|nr:amino acid ABC transporter permease [Naasia sp. SYSU D00057]